MKFGLIFPELIQQVSRDESYNVRTNSSPGFDVDVSHVVAHVIEQDAAVVFNGDPDEGSHTGQPENRANHKTSDLVELEIGVCKECSSLINKAKSQS